MDQPLWRPSPDRIADANISRFMAEVARRWNVRVDDYAALHRWSVAEPEAFWQTVWDFCGVIAEAQGDRVVADREKLPGARWFPDARLNFAENLLRRRDDGPAMIFWGEDRVKRRLSFAEVHDSVSRLRQALAQMGVGEGDRVAGFLPNLPETVIAMLAATSLGAVWSSCSPDFGVQGVLDRFGQIGPKVLFVADGYYFGGKTFDTLPKADDILTALPTVEHVVVVPYAREAPPLDALSNAIMWDAALSPYPAGEIDYVRVAFNAPLYIMYSSGTTGQPKCIVHGVGGTLLKHLEEHWLQADIKRDDRLFYFTTCGWMM